MKIEIDLKIILLILLFTFTSQIEIYGIFILFIFLHELAHIAVGFCFGLRVSSINMSLFGFSTELYTYKSRKSYIKIITYLAGPIFNLVCALIFYYSKIQSDMITNIVYTNFLLCFFNLLPILPLDGGRILKEILKKYIGNKNASIVMNMVTKVFLIAISAVYAVAILKLKNFAILFLIIYMWYLYSLEAKKLATLKRVYDIIERS